MKSQILFGPYLVATPPQSASGPVVKPLGLAIEWATPKKAPRIALFRRQEQPDGPTRLEHILVDVENLPFAVSCPECHVIETSVSIFVPLESLLFRLYQTHVGACSIFELLRSLAKRVQIYNRVSTPLNQTGLLIPKAEERGFLLNTCLDGPLGTIAEIAWRASEGTDPFHVCLCKRIAQGPCAEVEWVNNEMVGVSELLGDELRQILPVTPANLFSPRGLDLLKSRFAQQARGDVTA